MVVFLLYGVLFSCSAMILGFTLPIRLSNSSFLSGRLLQFYWTILSASVLFWFSSVVIFTLFEWVVLNYFTWRSSLFVSSFSGIWLSLVASASAPRCPLVFPTSLKHSIFLAAIDDLFLLPVFLPQWCPVRPFVCIYFLECWFFALISFLDDFVPFFKLWAVFSLFWIVFLTCFFAVFSCSGFRLLWTRLALFFIKCQLLVVVFAGVLTWCELFPIFISFTVSLLRFHRFLLRDLTCVICQHL